MMVYPFLLSGYSERPCAMSLTSRPYTDPGDLDLMKGLLRDSKRVHPYAGIHVGDLDWWVFYDTSGVPLEQKVRLWFEGEQLAAWTWTNWNDGDFDLLIHPAYRGAPQQETVLGQSIADLSVFTRQQPRTGDEPLTVTVHADEDDTACTALLQSWGFSAKPMLINFAQDIRRPIPVPDVPEGFTFLERVQPEDAERRALAHRDAFQPHSKMTPEHYRHFMTAPGYDPELDIALAAPDGQIVAFAMGWIDAANRLSEFEPVGTRYAFHRRGLGKAALLEGLRRLQARGVETALVSCSASVEGNIGFYQAAGFERRNRVLAFTKSV